MALNLSSGVYRVDPLDWTKEFNADSLSYQLANRDIYLEYRILRSMTETKSDSVKLVKLTADDEENNLFRDIAPYAHNLVSIPSNRYINASWIAYGNNSKAFIICQAPIQSTCDAFWETALHYNVSTIVCLSSKDDYRWNNSKDENSSSTFHYWRDISKAPTIESIKIIEKKSNVDDCLCYHEKLLFINHTKNSDLHTIQHIHLSSWDDMHVTDPYSVCTLIEYLIEIKEKHPLAPVLCHCIAGTGRAGTLLLILLICWDMKCQMMKGSVPCLSVLKSLIELRNQRRNLVSNFEQYLFVYDVIFCYWNKNKIFVS